MSEISCELPDSNPADPEIEELLKKANTIAIVGLSDKPERDSNKVAKYMIEKGYTVIPINPSKEEILGQKCYPDLASVPVTIDIVDVFRKMDALPETVNEAIALKPLAIWLQLGLAHKVSADRAREAGIQFVQSKCLKVEHSRIF